MYCRFDFLVTIVSLIGVLGQAFADGFYYITVLRPFRLLRYSYSAAALVYTIFYFDMNNNKHEFLGIRQQARAYGGLLPAALERWERKY